MSVHLEISNPSVHTLAPQDQKKVKDEKIFSDKKLYKQLVNEEKLNAYVEGRTTAILSFADAC